MKKIILKILIIILLFTGRIVLADTVNTIKYSNIYAVYEGTDRERLFNGERYEINGKSVYCIEPLLPVSNGDYRSSDNLAISGLGSEILNYVRLVSYYGYDYTNHNTRNYYLAAQELIWEKITGVEIYWIEGTNRNNQIDITNEKNEIITLINNHQIKPSFTLDEIIVYRGDNLDITDQNNVLDQYEILSSEIDDVVIQNNHLKTINNKNILEGIIRIKRKTYTNQVFLVYYNDGYQKLINTGKLDDEVITLKIKQRVHAKLKIIKQDMETDYPIHISDIYFKIINIDTGMEVCQTSNCLYKTNGSGEIMSPDYLDEGTYELYEVLDQRIPSYLVNNEKATFTISKNSSFKYINSTPYIEIIHKSKPVKGKLKVTTYGLKGVLDNNTFNYEGIVLNNVSYKLYANGTIYRADGRWLYDKGDTVSEVGTSSGEIIFDDLPIGNYCIIQTGTEGKHIMPSEPYCFTFKRFNYTLPVLEMTANINNTLPIGNVVITKYDSNNQVLSDAKIAIYDEDDNLIYTGVSDNEGVISLYNIPIGKYYFMELTPPYGYILDSNKYYFEIDNNDTSLNLSIVNELIKVPDTSKMDSYAIYIIYIIFIILGVLSFIYDKKK